MMVNIVKKWLCECGHARDLVLLGIYLLKEVRWADRSCSHASLSFLNDLICSKK